MYTFLLIKPGFHSWINAIKEGIYKMGTLTFYHKWERITFSCFSYVAQTERGTNIRLIFFSRLSLMLLNLTSHPLVLIVDIKIVLHNYIYN